MTHFLKFALVASILFTSTARGQRLDDQPRLPELKFVEVAVMTDSISCDRLARHVIQESRKIAVDLETANVVLVVVRSIFRNPLAAEYGTIDSLRADVEDQLNTSGPKGHIYVYKINEDRSVVKDFHSAFEWNDAIDDLR